MKKYFSVLLLLLSGTVALAAAPINTDVSIGYTYDDNVTRAELDRDIEKDSILNLDASAAYKIPVNDSSYFSLDGTLELNQYLDFDKLSNTRLGIHGSYHIRPSSGYTAMRYFAKLSYQERLYKSDQRDASASEIELGLAKRLTDVMSMRLGYIRQDINASSVVFDADNSRFYFDLDVKTSAKNLLYTTLGYVDGDVVSTTVPTPEIKWASSANVRDDAFLDLAPPRYAYKLAAKTTTIRLGDNYSFTSYLSIDASVLYYQSETDYYDSVTLRDISIDYSGLIFNLNYLYRY